MDEAYKLLIVNLTNQFFSLQNQIQSIMATQQEVVQLLSTTRTQLDSLTVQVQDLKNSSSNAGDALAELTDQAQAVAAGVQALANVLAGATVPPVADTTGSTEVPPVADNGGADTTGETIPVGGI